MSKCDFFGAGARFALLGLATTFPVAAFGAPAFDAPALDVVPD